MTVLFLFLLPLIAGLISFFIKDNRMVRIIAMISALGSLVLLVNVLKYFNAIRPNSSSLVYSTQWLGSLGSRFSLELDGLSMILCLLTTISYIIILIATWKVEYSRPNNFFGLMLLTQAGLIGVFTATDALLFYFFWELALVPVYFLCSGWGGERRIQVTFKFFIYTFTASVLMLIALLYLYFQTSDRSFALESFYNLHLRSDQQTLVFWLLFAAFAVKMPVFPFHTWQPDTYEQSPPSVTMVLSGLMVKMGVFGLLRWVLPVVPEAAYSWGDVAMSLGVIGIIYASVIAMQQDDLKRLIAYSSIAHIGLMAVTIFAENHSGMQGVMIQMFNHGINIIGLWIVAGLIERQFGTRKLSELGGIAQKAPALTAFLVIIALANIALPLTNSFIGEFLMFNGIWSSSVTRYHIVFAVLAALSIILAAVYTLTMIQKIFFGPTNTRTDSGHDIRIHEKFALGMIVLLILVFGIYPQPLLNLTNGFVDGLLREINVANVIVK
ncbi:MAG: NuoM family protein [Flavisolibacter sp.]